MSKNVDIDKIRRLRVNKGITKAAMSKQLSYETSIGYHYLEIGRCKISAKQLLIIADLLGVSISELIKEETETKESRLNDCSEITAT